MALNYELIYQAREIYSAVIDAQQKVAQAKDEMRLAEQRYKERLVRLTECTSLEYSNIACNANGIPTCVYAPKMGSQWKHCVFCDSGNCPDL